MAIPSTLMFLPGASGDTGFWRPLAERLAHPAEREIVAYPGFGGEPADPSIGGIDDLLARLLARIDRPTALIAQSMGGLLAVRAALERPELITHLVLSVTSGGVNMADAGAQDWRTGFAASHPHLPGWFLSNREDYSARLHEIRQPALLIWGDADPISPVAVGERLRDALPDARLHVVAGGGHDLAKVHAAALAPLVDAHLAR
ncbi:alpha/beta fold hydrolase [Burkholderia sp. 22PA0106]|uniref:alpha/beta fold hydrolase n=1 Tax=Burkholderia sp. 22PA0106 TaxID=3237371 RepID=UPI0039C1018F